MYAYLAQPAALIVIVRLLKHAWITSATPVGMRVVLYVMEYASLVRLAVSLPIVAPMKYALTTNVCAQGLAVPSTM